MITIYVNKDILTLRFETLMAQSLFLKYKKMDQDLPFRCSFIGLKTCEKTGIKNWFYKIKSADNNLPIIKKHFNADLWQQNTTQLA